MSIAAIDAAWGIDVSPPARKLVLLCMANRHNGITGQLNPSVDDVARSCGISADQARRHIHALIDAGLVEVIGNHYGGKPGMSRSYRLNLAITPCTDATPSMDATPGTDAAEGLHPCSTRLAPMQLTPCTHASQTGRNRKEPETNRNSERAKRATPPACPADVDQQVWADWMLVRKAKRAPITETVIAGAREEATKAGMTMNDFLVEWCYRGTQGLKAEWITGGQRGNGSNAHRPSRHSGFEKINYREGINDDGTFE